MGLKDQQRALAKLFTLDSARCNLLSKSDKFKEEDVDIKDTFFSGDELSMQIFEFADSLIKKRLGQVKQHIPGTCNIFKNKLAHIFQEYAKDKPTSGIKRHLYDSLMFMEFLDSNYSELLNSNIKKSIFKFERIWLKAILSNRFLYINSFSFDVSASIKKLNLHNQNSAVLLGSPRVCLWLKISNDKDLIYREVYPRFWPATLTKGL